MLGEALTRIGSIGDSARVLVSGSQQGGHVADGLAGFTIGLITNLANNLPVGLIASEVVRHAYVSACTVANLLIGVDLGPNLEQPPVS